LAEASTINLDIVRQGSRNGEHTNRRKTGATKKNFDPVNKILLSRRTLGKRTGWEREIPRANGERKKDLGTKRQGELRGGTSRKFAALTESLKMNNYGRKRQVRGGDAGGIFQIPELREHLRRGTIENRKKRELHPSDLGRVKSPSSWLGRKTQTTTREGRGCGEAVVWEKGKDRRKQAKGVQMGRLLKCRRKSAQGGSRTKVLPTDDYKRKVVPIKEEGGGYL